MRKLIVVVCAVALVFGSFAVVADAGSQQSFFNQLCKDTGNFFGNFKNHGACTSFFAKQLDSSGPVRFCSDEGPGGMQWWEALGFDNHGDCVSTMRDE